jgi:transketolase
MRAVGILSDWGVSIQHLHVTTLKPFNDPQVISAIKDTRFGTISMENHTINGGLGTCVAEMIAEHRLQKPLRKIALNDTYLQGASPKFLMRRYGIDALALVAQVEKLIGQKLDISVEDLAQARIDTYFNETQQEAL